MSQDEDQPRVSGSVQRAQFGGTPTASYGDVREGEVENWAWDKAKKAWDFISLPAKPIPEFFGSDYGSDPRLGKAYLEIQDLKPTYEYPPIGTRDMNGYERYRKFQENKITADKLNNMQDEAAKAAGAGVVYAMEKADWAWSHGVSRPLATYNLLAGEFLDQDDEKKLNVRDAWNRSATVSTGMAATDQMVETVGALVSMFGMDNPLKDWDVDLWDEKSINEAYQKSQAYSVVTGTIDLGLNFAPIPLGKGTGAVARKMGLSRHNVKVDYSADYDRINDGLKARGVDWDKPYAGRVDMEVADEVEVPQAANEFETAPPADTVQRVEVDPQASLYGRNALADEIIELTETDDIARIMESPVIKEMEGLDPVKVANLIANTSDYKTVARIHLATKGDKISAAKLFDSSPAVAARLAGIDDIIGKMEPGEYHEITPKERDAWIDSMTDWEKDLYNTLITDGGFVRQGSATMRTGMAGTNPLARATQSVARTLEKNAGTRADYRAAVKNQDFKRISETRVGYRTRTDADGFEYQEAIIGNKYGLLTHVFNFHPRIAGFAGRRLTNAFSRVPLNVFSFARTRPTDAMDEFYAMVADSPALAPGKTIRVQRPDGISYVEISSEDWIQNSARALAAAQTRGTTALREEVKRIEKEMVIQIGISKGLTPEDTLKFLDGFKQKADEAMAGIQENNGYMDTATQKMIQFDAQTIAMLADSEILVPLDQFSRHLDSILDSRLERAVPGTLGVAREAFDLGQAFFRTNMLLKPGYILRNAIFEPGITALIAHMSAAPLLLGRDAVRGAFNVMVNTGQRFDEVLRYLPPSGKRKLDAAYRRVQTAVFEKDNQVARLLDLGERAPSVKKNSRMFETHTARAKEMAMIALRSVADIDEDLAVEFFEEADFEFSARIATGAAKTLDGSDEVIDSVTREIEEIEAIMDDAIPLNAVDEAYLTRLRIEQEILLAVRDTRQSLRTIRQRKAERSGRQMTADEADNQVIYSQVGGDATTSTVLAEKVQKLLEVYKDKGVRIVASEEYDEIVAELRAFTDEVQEATVEALGKRAKYVGKKARLERKKQRRRRSGEAVRTIRIGGKDGQDIEYREPFSGTKGEAYRVDSSGRITAQQNFGPMGGESVVHSLARMRLTAEETKPISPMDDAYWDDLHHYATRHFADEPYIRPAFEPKTLDAKGRDARIQAIVDLISPDQGFRQEMGLRNAREIRAHAREIVEIVDTYYPSQAAKDLVVSGKKFGPGELAEAVLSDPAAVLSPIEGRIIKAMDSKKYRRFKSLAVNALDKMWAAIAVSPEAKLGRWPYYVRQHEIAFKRIMDDAFANSPDGKVSIGQQRAAQLAAHREALATLEKTFYTIRRYNRSVFTSRFLQSFPGAWANGLWRYMYYIPKNKPAETLTALLVGKDTLDTLLKGEDGEPANYWDDDARIVFPLTKGIEIAGIELDNGWQVGKDAYTKIFAEIPPSRSYLVAATVDSVLQYGPQFLRKFGAQDQADNLQTFVDDLGDYYAEQTGDTTLFDEVIRPSLFSEYGPTKEFLFGGPVGKLVGSVTPGWMRSAETLARSGMESYTNDYIRLAKYRMQVVEAERAANEDSTPINFEKEVAPYATKWFALRFVEQWTNLAFGAVPLPNYPGSLERDAWRKINGDKNNEDMSYEDKLFLLDQMFPNTPLEELLPFTKSTSKNVYDVPTTVDAFNYVERHSETAAAIANDFPEMPTMVGILALGKDDTWSASSNTIYQAMKGKGPYPGAELNYIEDISMQDYAIELNVARAWEEFEAIDSRYQIEIERADAAGDKEAVKELKDGRRRWIKGYGDDPESMRVKWPAWYSMYGPSADKSENTANAIMDHIIENDKIWNDKKDDPAWQLIAQFLVDRDAVEQLRLETPSTTEGRKYKQELKDWMYETYSVEMAKYPMTKDLWDNTFESDYYEEPIDIGGAQ